MSHATVLHKVLYPLIRSVSGSSLFPLISSPLPHILSSFSSCQFTISPLFKEHPPPCFHHPLMFLSIVFFFFFSSGLPSAEPPASPSDNPTLPVKDDDGPLILSSPCSSLHCFHIPPQCYFASFSHVIVLSPSLFLWSSCVLVTLVLLAPHPLEPLHRSVVGQILSFLCRARLSR